MNTKTKFNILYLGIVFYSLLYHIIYKLVTDFYYITGYPLGLYAFNYIEYGFIKRALPGTLVYGILKIIPDIYSYNGLLILTYILTGIFTVLLYLVLKTVLEKTEYKLTNFAIICSMFLVISYWNSNLFGMPDIYLLIIGLIEVLLILKEKYEWLVLPLTVAAVLIHEGYMCMFAPILLVLLMYRYQHTKEKKYLIYFISCIIIIGSLGTYLLKLSPFDIDLYNKAVQFQKDIHPMDSYYEGITAQILKHPDRNEIDFFFEDVLQRARIQLSIFIPLCLPYLYVYIKSSSKKLKTLSIVGFVLILPMFILFCDYGRYVTYIVYYILLLVLSLAFYNDKCVENFGDKLSVNSILPYPYLILWTLFLTPLLCFYINYLTVYIEVFTEALI